jgi:hypothetical protein
MLLPALGSIVLVLTLLRPRLEEKEKHREEAAR